MRFNPVVGFIFAVAVLLFWLYQGFTGPRPEDANPTAKRAAAPVEGLALVAGGDRHRDGPAAALVSVLSTLESQADIPITYLDRVTEGEAARAIGRLARQGWPLILVEGAENGEAAQAVAEARPETHMALVGAPSDKAGGRLSHLSLRHWEAGALAGVAAALASETGKIALLDMTDGREAGQSFEKGARSAREGVEAQVVRPRSPDQPRTEAQALLSGLAAQGVDMVVARADDATLAAIVDLAAAQGLSLIAWRPWGASDPTAWGEGNTVIGRVIQRPEKLVAALLEAKEPGQSISLGLAEGAQDLEIREGILDAAALDRLNAYRDGLAREGLRGLDKGDDAAPPTTAR